MIDNNAAVAAEGGATTGDPDVDAITTPDPRAGEGAEPAADDVPEDVKGFAKRLGWIEEERYRGPKDKWLPADRFVDKVEKEVPVLRERLRFQDEVMRKQQEKLDAIAARSEKSDSKIDQLLGKQLEAEYRGHMAYERRLEEEMDQAAAEADTARYNDAKRRLVEVGKHRPPAPGTKSADADGGAPGKKIDAPDTSSPPAGDGMLPETRQWIEDNAWFKTNSIMRAAAQTLEMELARDKPGMSNKERLEEVAQKIREEFPTKFENQRRNGPSSVAGSSTPTRGGTPVGKKQKTVADLDPDAKAALQRIQRLDPKFKTEDYLKTYFEDKK